MTDISNRAKLNSFDITAAQQAINPAAQPKAKSVKVQPGWHRPYSIGIIAGGFILETLVLLSLLIWH